MKKLPLTLAALAFSAFPALAQDVPVVIDPATGIDIAVTDIDMTLLTDEQRQDVRDQVAISREDRRSTMEQTRERTRERTREHAGEMGGAAGSGAGAAGGFGGGGFGGGAGGHGSGAGGHGGGRP